MIGVAGKGGICERILKKRSAFGGFYRKCLMPVTFLLDTIENYLIFRTGWTGVLHSGLKGDATGRGARKNPRLLCF